MTRAELTTLLREASGDALTLGQAKDVTERLLDTFREKLVSGRQLTLPDLGKVVVSDTPERNARNPRTGEPIIVPEGVRFRFKPSVPIKRAILDARPKKPEKLDARPEKPEKPKTRAKPAGKSAARVAQRAA